MSFIIFQSRLNDIDQMMNICQKEIEFLTEYNVESVSRMY
jgi:hypothetical protein